MIAGNKLRFILFALVAGCLILESYGYSNSTEEVNLENCANGLDSELVNSETYLNYSDNKFNDEQSDDECKESDYEYDSNECDNDDDYEEEAIKKSTSYYRLMQNQHQQTQGDTECTSQLGLACTHTKTCGQAPLNPMRASYALNNHYELSSAGQWPFMASLYIHSKFTCDATIVSEYHMVTAKYCLKTRKGGLTVPVEALEVVLGTHLHFHTLQDSERNRISFDTNAKVLRVKRFVLSPEDDRDLAWLYFDEPFRLSNYLQPICYPYEKLGDETSSIGTKGDPLCFLVGYGRSVSKRVDKRPDRIGHMQVKMADCPSEIVKRLEKSICYTRFSSDTHPGEGDSGSPLVCLDNHVNRWRLMGIHYSELNYKNQYFVVTPLDTAFAKLSTELDSVCNRPQPGSTICQSQRWCTKQLAIPDQPYLVRIDKVAHDAISDGGIICSGVLVSYNLVLTDRKCSLALYRKGNFLDIAPLDSFKVSLKIRRSGQGKIQAVDSTPDLQLRVDEIYVLRKFDRNLIMLRLERDLNFDTRDPSSVLSRKRTICWPINREIIKWNKCTLTRFVEPYHSIGYPVNKIPCPIRRMSHIPDDILSCWESVEPLKPVNGIYPDIWISGSPIACFDQKNQRVLVAVIKEGHQNWGMGASIRSDDLKMSYWWREIIRYRSPKATLEF